MRFIDCAFCVGFNSLNCRSRLGGEDVRDELAGQSIRVPVRDSFAAELRLTLTPAHKPKSHGVTGAAFGSPDCFQGAFNVRRRLWRMATSFVLTAETFLGSEVTRSGDEELLVVGGCS